MSLAINRAFLLDQTLISIWNLLLNLGTRVCHWRLPLYFSVLTFIFDSLFGILVTKIHSFNQSFNVGFNLCFLISLRRCDVRSNLRCCNSVIRLEIALIWIKFRFANSHFLINFCFAILDFSLPYFCVLFWTVFLCG